MYCKKCGNLLKDNDEKCMDCGFIVENVEEKVVAKKSNKFSIWIKKYKVILIVLVFLIIIGTAVYFLLLKKEEPKKNEINYETVLKEYGDNLQTTVEEFINNYGILPSFEDVKKLITYKEYTVNCDTTEIYENGTVYLSDCSVESKNISNTYGEIYTEEVIEEEAESTNGSIDIYLREYDSGYKYYSNTKNDDNYFVGDVSCIKDDCTFISAYDRYVLIKDNNEYYLMDYVNDTIAFGPYSIKEDEIYYSVLEYNHVVYGILYEEDSDYAIYNISLKKSVSGFPGKIFDNPFYDATSMLRVGKYISQSEDETEYYIIDITSNGYEATISAYILSDFLYDSINKTCYIIAADEEYKNLKVYNDSGELLLNGKTFNKVGINNSNLVVTSDDKIFKVYDKEMKLVLTSKEYNTILEIYDTFIVVIDTDNKLKIIDMQDKELASFIEWDENKYTFHSMISGWYTYNDKYGIYLIVENMDIEFGNMGSGLEYYYIPATGETGVIETEGVGGYAKPVLYLYPTKDTFVDVTFANPNMLTTTYPKFNTSWKMYAKPNGDLYDANGKYYYALYWEELKNHTVDFSTGFYVTKDNAITFLEEKLSTIGLNNKERNEFIMYWLPILEKNEKSLVYFELTEERDLNNKLIIKPVPDSLLRVAIHVKKVEKKVSIKEEKLETFNRLGFTAVEWGGVNY